MKPVIIGDCQLWLGDCMNYMAGLPDKAFDLAIVDPPYGINAPKMSPTPSDRKSGSNSFNGKSSGKLNSGGGKLKERILNNADCNWDSEIPSSEYFDELRRVSVNQIIWGGNYFNLPPTRGIVCWDKVQPWPNFSAWEMAWTSFDCVARIFKFSAAIAKSSSSFTVKATGTGLSIAWHTIHAWRVDTVRRVDNRKVKGFVRQSSHVIHAIT